MPKVRIGAPSDWRFVNGIWTDGEKGELLPPETRAEDEALQGMRFAINRRLCYQDCTVRLEFSVNSHSDVGVIFRARDEAHFYLLHFPNCGQACRAQHFWVALSKMDGGGCLKLIKMDMVRRVPSSRDTWLRGEISSNGSRFIVRVGDYGHFEVEDHTFTGPGYLVHRGRKAFP